VRFPTHSRGSVLPSPETLSRDATVGIRVSQIEFGAAGGDGPRDSHEPTTISQGKVPKRVGFPTQKARPYIYILLQIRHSVGQEISIRGNESPVLQIVGRNEL